jgi:hypothetical protein
MSYLEKIKNLEAEIKKLQNEIDRLHETSQYVDMHQAVDMLPTINKKESELDEKSYELAQLKEPRWDNEYRGGKRKSSKRKSSKRKTAKRRSSKRR